MNKQRLYFDWVQMWDESYWTTKTALGNMRIFKCTKDGKYSLSISTEPMVMKRLENEDDRAYITRFDSLVECQKYLEGLYFAKIV